MSTALSYDQIQKEMEDRSLKPIHRIFEKGKVRFQFHDRAGKLVTLTALDPASKPDPEQGVA